MYNLKKTDNKWLILTHIDYSGSTITNLINGIPNTQYRDGNAYTFVLTPETFTQNINEYTCSAATYILSSNTMYVTGSTSDVITYNNEYLTYYIPNIFSNNDLEYLVSGECTLNIVTELGNIKEKIKIK